MGSKLRGRLWRNGNFRRVRLSRKGKISNRNASTAAQALLAAAPEPVAPGWRRPLREDLGSATGDDNVGGGSVHERDPLVESALWRQLPPWIALYAERGREPRCFFGHRLYPADSCRLDKRGCYKCGVCPLPIGSPMLKCRSCGWGVCAPCAALPRLPALGDDPLFHGSSEPCLLGPPGVPPAKNSARGTVIICPGGNYEFLCPNEGLPVASWLVQHGINACVLKYRLLPKHPHSEAVDDLLNAVRLVRASCGGGPVAALGFSAGGHLSASMSAHVGQRDTTLDAQVLVYPGLDGTDWLRAETCGFFDERCLELAPTLLDKQEALLGGSGFAAPRTLLVASTTDEMCPPEAHCDPYAQALSVTGIPHRYLRRDFGPHGFALDGGWTDECIAWLKQNGFGLDSARNCTTSS